MRIFCCASWGCGKRHRSFTETRKSWRGITRENIRYNAVCTGKYFIHNLQYTDPDLLAAAEAKAAAEHTSLTKIHVKQGYTRCSLLPVDDQSFITSDTGIAKTLADYDTDVLLIRPGHILLPGFDYGFIGAPAAASSS